MKLQFPITMQPSLLTLINIVYNLMSSNYYYSSHFLNSTNSIYMHIMNTLKSFASNNQLTVKYEYPFP